MNEINTTTTVETAVETTPVKTTATKPAKTSKPKAKPAKAPKAKATKTKTTTGWEPRLPQVRILRVLEKAPMTRGDAARKAGFQPGSGTASVAFNGRKAAGVVGLIKAKAVDVVEVDVDGKREELLKITGLGKRSLKAALNGTSKLPSMRDASLCTNERFTAKAKKSRKTKAK